MSRMFNKNTKATLAGYISAIYGALIVLDIDNMDWSLPSSYFKIFGAVVMPIVAGHVTQLKSTNLNER